MIQCSFVVIPYTSIIMTHYDHITFHLDEHYPTDLPALNAINHIGFFYAWATANHLVSEQALQFPEMMLLKRGLISGSVFVLNQLGGGIDETCFNDLGNRFVQYYYHDDEEGYGNFLADYFTALGLENDSDFYRVADTPENQKKLNAVFQAAFEHWYATLQA